MHIAMIISILTSSYNNKLKCKVRPRTLYSNSTTDQNDLSFSDAPNIQFIWRYYSFKVVGSLCRENVFYFAKQSFNKYILCVKSFFGEKLNYRKTTLLRVWYYRDLFMVRMCITYGILNLFVFVLYIMITLLRLM